METELNEVKIVLNSHSNIVNLSKFARLEKNPYMKKFTVNFIKTLNRVLPDTIHNFVSKTMPQFALAILLSYETFYICSFFH